MIGNLAAVHIPTLLYTYIGYKIHFQLLKVRERLKLKTESCKFFWSMSSGNAIQEFLQKHSDRADNTVFQIGKSSIYILNTVSQKNLRSF